MVEVEGKFWVLAGPLGEDGNVIKAIDYVAGPVSLRRAIEICDDEYGDTIPRGPGFAAITVNSHGCKVTDESDQHVSDRRRRTYGAKTIINRHP